MELNKNARMKLFQKTTGWSTDKMRANKKAINNIVGNDKVIPTDVITYSEQDLTEEQKAQARANISAISKEEAEALIITNNAIVVAALPEPSEETMGKTYLLGPDQTDNYIRYITSYDNTTYTWVPYGSTKINLSEYIKKDINSIKDNLAKFDANGNTVDSGISKDNVALKDGSYNNMSVGIAKNLEGRSVVIDSFFQRTTGGNTKVANGIAQLNEIKGNSQVWNQLVENGNFINITKWSFNGNKSASNNILTISSIEGTGQSNALTGNILGTIINHKYYIRVSIKFNETLPSDNVFIGSGGYDGIYIDKNEFSLNVWKDVFGIFKRTTERGDDTIRIYPRFNGVGKSMNVKNFICIDLTLLGIDNLIDVKDIESWLAENIGTLSYYSYNSGQVINNNFQGIESIGKNLLDPVTGKAIIVGKYSDVYGNYYGITGTHGTIIFTDNIGNSETITPDAEGKFELLVPGILKVNTPGKDCSVFLWWDGTKSEYTTHEVNVGKLDIIHIYGKKNGTGELVQVWPTGMPGIDDINDSIKVIDGQVVAERNIGEVDMGTLNWSLRANSSYTFNIVDNNVPINYARNARMLWKNGFSVGINTGDIAKNYPNYQICHYNATPGKGIYINYPGVNNENALKTALNKVPLYYKLITPEIYTDLVYQGSSIFTDGTPVTLPVNYKVDKLGIENILPKNTEYKIFTSKPTIICKYSIDAIKILNDHDTEINQLEEEIEELNNIIIDLQRNYISKKSLQAMLNAMQSAGIIASYTMTYNENTNKYDFTFVANN